MFFSSRLFFEYPKYQQCLSFCGKLFRLNETPNVHRTLNKCKLKPNCLVVLCWKGIYPWIHDLVKVIEDTISQGWITLWMWLWLAESPNSYWLSRDHRASTKSIKIQRCITLLWFTESLNSCPETTERPLKASTPTLDVSVNPSPPPVTHTA